MRKTLSLGITSLCIILLLVTHVGASELSPRQTQLSEAEIAQQLQSLPGWTRENQQLRRTYQFKNFVEAIDFVNRLVEPAETAGHHPDILISYNQVTLTLTTHDVGGLTQKDFDLAKIISQLVIQSELGQ